MILPHRPEGSVMPVAKVIELTATSTKSFEDAIREGISRANDTLSEVKGAWIQEQKVVVDKGKVVEYRVNMKVTFLLKSGKSGKSK
jgi:flavin-binding protein dodecin